MPIEHNAELTYGFASGQYLWPLHGCNNGAVASGSVFGIYPYNHKKYEPIIHTAMTKGGGIYAWIAWGMFSLVHKQVQKHYTDNGRQKTKPRWGYGPATRKPAPTKEQEINPAP